ncbi:hypothetical protein ACWCXH_11180 [Kitasatospora sp. NPDC001660]
MAVGQPEGDGGRVAHRGPGAAPRRLGPRRAHALDDPDEAWEELFVIAKALRARGTDDELAAFLAERDLTAEHLDD